MSGLVSPSLPDGTRRNHRRRLNRSSDEEEQHLPLTPVSIASNSDSFVSIPENLVSLATFEHLGYNSETATRIWEYWTNWPTWGSQRGTDDIGGVPFIEVAEYYINSSLDTCEDDDDQWLHCMNLYGINCEFQEAIMDPKFRHIRLTESCKYWVQDTIKLRYRGLEAAQTASRERCMASRRKASQADSGQRSASDKKDYSRMVSWLSRETALSTAATNAAANAPGYTTLYKVNDQAQLDRVFGNNGHVNVGWLLSRKAADFSLVQEDLYLVLDREVAEYHACYMKRRSICSAVGIIHIAIPNSVIESLSPPDIQHIYWPSTEWKSLIFNCRRQQVPLLSELQKYNLATILVGTICGKSNISFRNMLSPDEVTERMVLKPKDGRNAIQYVFKGEDGFILVEDSSRVVVFPLTTREFEAWSDAV
ncbi:hypothetical protein N7519_011667 [Penicillium mononematosum]|uniref:uncharacterized protein n=1 Tax=Penicillium mononematosum TaxID=268346 RepID=UPI0025472768|nr:uncharacterized protein N7519_011667 [Penicillium mononematosum]KAJ6181206.1 hypothetical protein N7519_011667 [Penicillium mononematosum]